MKPSTLVLIEAALATDETLTTVSRRLILDTLVTRSTPETPRTLSGPLLTKKAAAARIGVSTTTFWKMLKELPANLPDHMKVQVLRPGLERVPEALVEYFLRCRGNRLIDTSIAA